MLCLEMHKTFPPQKERYGNIMNKKIVLSLITIIASVFLLASCNKDDNNVDNTEDTAYAYCTTYYSTECGNGGSFEISPLEDAELETDFSDLSKFTLGGAFSGMTLSAVTLADDSSKAEFYITGELVAGDSGSVEGEGIIKGKSVKVDVPITQAFAESSSKIYAGVEEQTITLELTATCFNKNLTADNFVLSGAAEGMTIKSINSNATTDTDGEEYLSQTAELTLTGKPDGTDYAYITILSSATTYNKDLDVSLATDFYGGTITNDSVDTYKLADTVYIKANNLNFNASIKSDDITLGGAFENYATIVEVEYISSDMVAIKMSFPYTFVSTSSEVGYISFVADSNEEGIAFSCFAILKAPKISYDLGIDGNQVTMQLTLTDEEFNLLDSYPFTLCKADGTEIIVSDLEIENLGEYLSVKFTVTEGFSGLLYFELENAYNIVDEKGETQNVTIKTAFYVY